MNDNRPILGITLGDPAGVGPEITVKALAEQELYEEVRPLVFGDRCVLEAAIALCGGSSKVHAAADPGTARFQPGTIDLVDTGGLSAPPPLGMISAAAGRAGYVCLERAIEAALAGSIDALVTAPLNKESLRAAQVPFLDHTAVLTARAARYEPMTLFMAGPLRIFFLTRHIPFREIAGAITPETFSTALPLCLRYLRHLGIEDPQLAVAALNPHGGERGLFGREEMEIIAPAIDAARSRGLKVTGPVPADAVFHQASAGLYDGILALYHDQGHIAAKTLDFYGTVSLTMGLNFLRTSVDHGTALDIAGQGRADSQGMTRAIQVGGRYALGVKARLAL
ncbi:MAG: 4-hydroxythreonine-4-phosphate dehydrogenase PdxA [Syntrophaceae bacterium]|nr:4-hydroxythreonine-4-phosphate dehydrogenase PdxA [Syntrophaceae bacterium]